MSDPALDRKIQAIARPDKTLWSYYLLVAAAIPPAFPFVVLPLYFRYRTMRYQFNDDGISMSWGILFRRQIIVNYARIQDLHLKSNLIERWLGLARIQIQTASGNHAAEMTIEGVKEFEAVRDYLYARTRGVKARAADPGAPAQTAGAGPVPATDELTAVLRAAVRELRALRETLTPRERPHSETSPHG